MRAPRSIVILTGAGISAESGVATFRGKDGTWAQVDYRDVATPEGFARNPAMVHEFYNTRRRGMADVKPNPAHFALARLELEFPGDFLLVTQNIDDLHEQAGSRKLIHMHGELGKAKCAGCGARREWLGDLSVDVKCEACGEAGGMRPDVVWCGEFRYRVDEIGEALSRCDLFVSIGTSGTVYPAASFVAEARAAGARTVELNLEPLEGESLFLKRRYGPATKIVPASVEETLAGLR